MKEIGGYIEFESNNKKMLHENGIRLNCGRNALAYIIMARKIKKIAFPYFMCDSCERIFDEQNISVRYYHIDWDLKPTNIELDDDEWLYLVNYYGQLSNGYIQELANNHSKIIVDNAQAYFQAPIDGIDTLYTCRKFFGVPDGAVLYTEQKMDYILEQDESFERMHHLLGRFERTASEFYSEYVANGMLFNFEPIKKMSKLTENLLRGIDYESVERRRFENFLFLHETLGPNNKLDIRVPNGPFMYPFYAENGDEIKKELQKRKVYIPTLWPNVLEMCDTSDLEYRLAKNIVPLPCDQRYSIEDMKYVCEYIYMLMGSTDTLKGGKETSKMFAMP